MQPLQFHLLYRSKYMRARCFKLRVSLPRWQQQEHELSVHARGGQPGAVHTPQLLQHRATVYESG